MLIDNTERFIEVMIDNLIRGNIVIDWNEIVDGEDGVPSLSDCINDYIRNRRLNKKQPSSLVFDLAFCLKHERIFGNIKGQIHDVDQEAENHKLKIKIKDLESDNKIIVGQLESIKSELDKQKETKPVDHSFRGIQ